jgi:chemotaxis protein MotB
MRKIVNASLALVAATLLFSACVPTRRWKDSEAALRSARNDSALQAAKIHDLQSNVAQLNQQVSDLKQQVGDLNNKTGQLSTDAANKQSLLSKSQQELANQQKRLEQLQALMDQQKGAIQAIRKKMSDALVGFDPKDLSVAIKNGKVYVSLQENLLFPSGSAVVNPKGKDALGKLAQVLNSNPDITVDIEGHTDSIPIRGRYEDNWALSVARASSIVRILTKDYQVDPVRVIASGHSSYDPVQTNSTPEGRALNRRTEIILSPKLDELYKLLENTDETASGQH